MSLPTKPVTRDVTPEYETVWTGAHRGADADLLTISATAKREPSPGSHVTDDTRLSAHDITRQLRVRPHTMAELADTFAVSLLRINSLLYLLQQRGEVVWDETDRRQAFGGRVRRYRLAEPLDSDRACGAHTRGAADSVSWDQRKERSGGRSDQRGDHPSALTRSPK